MKILNILICILLCLTIIVGVASASDISIEYEMIDLQDGDNIADTENQCCDIKIQNVYPVKDVQNNKANIAINNIKEANHIYVYIDGCDESNFVSGGVSQWENHSAIYTIPHNLGEGKHKISFLCMKGLDNVLSKQTFDLIIETNETNESPFWYDIEDKDENNNYILNNNTSINSKAIVTTPVLLQNNNITNNIYSAPPQYVNVSLGDFIIQKQNNFDIIEYILSFFK